MTALMYLWTWSSIVCVRTNRPWLTMTIVATTAGGVGFHCEETEDQHHQSKNCRCDGVTAAYWIYCVPINLLIPTTSKVCWNISNQRKALTYTANFQNTSLTHSGYFKFCLVQQCGWWTAVQTYTQTFNLPWKQTIKLRDVRSWIAISTTLQSHTQLATNLDENLRTQLLRTTAASYDWAPPDTLRSFRISKTVYG